MGGRVAAAAAAELVRKKGEGGGICSVLKFGGA
jgi:hypothetical protein